MVGLDMKVNFQRESVIMLIMLLGFSLVGFILMFIANIISYIRALFSQ